MKIRFDRQDILVSITAIAILLGLSYFLFEESFRRVEGGQGEEIGRIYYRYRIAQRKYSSRVLWEGVDQGNIVYNKDSIRTDSQSEAVIKLSDGTEIEMDPDSMVVLYRQQGEQEIEFVSGSIVLKRSANSKLKLRNGERKGIMENGIVRMILSKGKLLFRVDEGKVFIEGKALKKGITSEITPKGVVEIPLGAILQKPADNARFFGSEARSNVSFIWSKGKCETPFTFVIIRESLPNDPWKEVVLSNTEYSLELEEGIYYWTIGCSGSQGALQSETRKFRIVHNPPINATSPQPNSTHSGFVPFNWLENAMAVRYRLIVSTEEDLSNPVFDGKIQRTGISLSLPEGTYRFKVIAEGAFPKATSETTVETFYVKNAKEDVALNSSENKDEVVDETIEKKPANGKDDDVKKQQKSEVEVKPKNEMPSIVLPAPGQTLDMAKQNFILFRWVKVDDAKSYSFKLYSSDGQLVDEVTLQATQLKFNDLSKLDVGQFSWTVEAYADGKSIGKSNGRFNIILSQELEKPEFEEK